MILILNNLISCRFHHHQHALLNIKVLKVYFSTDVTEEQFLVPQKNLSVKLRKQIFLVQRTFE